jgi:hypothetical protein
MNLSELEHAVFAYFVAEHADTFNLANRYYPYGELVLVWEDKISVATRKFGARARSKSKAASTALLDLMIEKGGYSNKTNDFGGTMHSFQQGEFRRILKELKETDPIILKANESGPDFWAGYFAELTRD